MTSVVESLPTRMRQLFTDVLGAHDPDLLEALTTHEEPTNDERLEVVSILADEFARRLGPDSEPTGRGLQVDELAGVFLRRWPTQAT